MIDFSINFWFILSYFILGASLAFIQYFYKKYKKQKTYSGDLEKEIKRINDMLKKPVSKILEKNKSESITKVNIEIYTPEKIFGYNRDFDNTKSLYWHYDDFMNWYFHRPHSKKFLMKYNSGMNVILRENIKHISLNKKEITVD